MHKNLLAKSVRLAMISGAAAAAFSSPVAFAAEEGEKVERIEVTGSRIKRTDMEGVNPVTVIDAAAIEKMSVNNVGDLLQNLTSSAGAATNTQTNNGGDSSTRFSLRGIGSDRTLVLINGRRVVAGGGGANSSVDLNTIPTAIVKRVEVLKDGASATYGSDAIAGVVNIITKNDFEGFEIKANYSSSDKGDAETTGVDVTFGAQSERGNVVVSLGYSDQEDAFMGDRSFSEFELRAYEDGTTQEGGSSAPPWVNANTADGRVTRGPEYGDWRAYDGSTDSYNYNPVNYLQTPSKRRHASVFANYSLGDFGFLGEVNSFAEANYVQTVGNRLIAPEPLAPLVFFGSPAPYSANNYYNQKMGPKDSNGNSYVIDDWRRRMLETGGRANERDYKTFRTVVGFNGYFSNGWDWEVSHTWGQSDSVEKAAGYFNLDRVAEAVGPTGWLDANGDLMVDNNGNAIVDAAGSELVCLDADGGVIGGCTPLNIFGTPGSADEISPEMLQYISGDYNTTETGQNKQEVLQAIVSGDLFDLPAGSVGFALGWEDRKESGSYTPDSLILQGTTTAGSAVGTQGGYDVQEFFGELIVPVLSDLPFAHKLDIEAAVRYSDYSTFGDNTSAKVGVKWMPIDTLMVRATLSDAFRAPTTSDLYGGAATGFPEAIDPCDGNFYTDAEYAAIKASPNWANCVATGVPQNGYDSGGVEQIPTKGGGADNWNGAVTVTPETADVFTVGFVYNPEFIDNLSMTVDYWKIELENAISTVGTQTRLDGCFNNAEYCETINRFTSGAAEGGIIDVQNYTVNVGGINTAGIDYDFRYTFETGFGDWGLGLDGTYLLEYDKFLADGSVVDHVGRFEGNHDGMFAELKTNFTVSWAVADFNSSLITRYISGVKEVEAGWWTAPFERDVDSNIVVDFQTNYMLNDHVTLTAGVDNVFDEEPPFVYSAFGANTDVSTYDVIGRSIYVRAGIKF
ncbi:TonB-dependent receptor domain-containing protein [Shewanella sp. 10N.286.48.B5]|uniref:TonB-dependent receptor domain-containing protein n=1 Tax=Shewanella sp. 10N.286.48.B5 TaxID=1880834 RepID=UPI000C83DD2B|nr:TonB-dependent receptor [Shewanella sp. 10N.286.48.B5]PMH88922.1 TonB-dependent receptor [Shewanella sp. 10N.286.48.B5]